MRLIVGKYGITVEISSTSVSWYGDQNKLIVYFRACPLVWHFTFSSDFQVFRVVMSPSSSIPFPLLFRHLYAFHFISTDIHNEKVL